MFTQTKTESAWFIKASKNDRELGGCGCGCVCVCVCDNTYTYVLLFLLKCIISKLSTFNTRALFFHI